MEISLKSKVTWCDAPLSRSQFGVLKLFTKAKLMQGCHCADNCAVEVGVDVIGIIK